MAEFNPKVWRTVITGGVDKPGKGETYGDLQVSKLAKQGIDVTNDAAAVMRHMKQLHREGEVRLTRVKLHQIGILSIAGFKQVSALAQGCGLFGISQEAVVRARMQYRDQPQNERLLVATDAVNVSLGYYILQLERGGQGGATRLRLSAYPINGGFRPGDEMVFGC